MSINNVISTIQAQNVINTQLLRQKRRFDVIITDLSRWKCLCLTLWFYALQNLLMPEYKQNVGTGGWYRLSVYIFRVCNQICFTIHSKHAIYCQYWIGPLSLERRYMSGMTSQITCNSTVCSKDFSANNKENVKASCYWSRVPSQWPVLGKWFPCYDVIVRHYSDVIWAR